LNSRKLVVLLETDDLHGEAPLTVIHVPIDTLITVDVPIGTVR
jgi:hypothetical protein